MTCLTFIIPIRHQDNSDSWSILVQNLKQTVKSISAQTHHDWKCIIVANQGAELPELPDKFDLCLVDFPPNEFYIQGSGDLEDFREAVRLDKGKRLLSGIKHAGDTQYFMFVDDDDLIHCDLAKFVCEHVGENGWYINDGLIWQNNTNLLMNYKRFYLFCGTSHIIRSDLLIIDQNEPDEETKYIKRMLGSHIYLKEELDVCQTPLAPLPFRGAIYRIGHPDAHSKIRGIMSTFFFTKKTLKSPKTMIKRTLALRRLTTKLKRIYFGEM